MWPCSLTMWGSWSGDQVAQLEREGETLRQTEEQAITDPVERFMYNFRGYSDEKLQQVIDGRGYVPEAKKAAKQLLYRRKYGE